MCLILFSWQPEEPRRLVVLANRDEFHARKSSQAAFWSDHPEILAGRDLEAGGSWLGLSTAGRFATVTNYRQPGEPVKGARSRGELTVNFLTSSAGALDFAHALSGKGQLYNGFSLLLYDGQNMVSLSNRDFQEPMLLAPGVYGLSNHLLDTPWPKVSRGKAELIKALVAERSLRQMLPILLDSRVADDVLLPDTGIGLEWERMLSAPCIRGQDYGTRCATALEISSNRRARLIEHTLVPAGLTPETVEFELLLD